MNDASTDPLLSSLAEDLLAFVEDQLSNNDVASDDELKAHFVARGLTDVQATRAIRYRSLYLQNIFLQGHTPIRKNKHAIRFDPQLGRFQRISR